ncbi:universal stress protein [Yoonia litorea]|uniref:Nucleotide-binding universal stress protein, UspA family n=1 Tax=Yoonia litorea TaxID=1123755 RepID=A0A1I6MLW2_9RHOB|nr:universal stress protein [Yoonia litorea]SFS16695.1 Nucleotide-binding universal stress protein, UspA family [Yoonia litorea]
MYNKILVPMALDHGVSEQTIKIAQGLSGGTGEIIALHVYEAPQRSVAAYLDEAAVKESMATAKSNLAEKTAQYAGVRAELVQGHSARTIIDYAADNGIDCIVMGSHKPGLSDYFLGSTAARVVQHAPCAVHVVRDRP